MSASTSSPAGMTDPVPELIRLLGEPVVFIAWPKGVKGDNRHKWGHLTPADMTPEYLAKLPHGNIGVALGSVSGGLCAIDCDTDGLAESFIRLNPHLKGTLQTHGARGRVYWVRFKGPYLQAVKKLKSAAGDDLGEYRSTGGQSIVSGMHPDTQKPYSFVVRKPVVRVKFKSIRWPKEISNPPTLQRNRSHILCVSASLPSLPSLPTPSLWLSVKSIHQAVDLCIPEKEHQNNAVLFRLARAMLALKASQKETMRAFDLWYQKSAACRMLRPGQSRDQYLVEFMNARRRAKLPLGAGPAEIAWKLASTTPPPPEAKLFESPEGKLLVSLCWQMNKLAKGESWFLATRTAARLTGMSHTKIATWLSALVQMGILEITALYTKDRATRYRYVARKRAV